MTLADLHRLFGPSYQERQWAPTVARTPASQAALLVQLKVFQCIGRFRSTENIPSIIVEYIAGQLDVSNELYRAHPSVPFTDTVPRYSSISA